MRTVVSSKMWVLGGTIGIAVMLAIGWFFVIAPQNAETGRLKDEAETARTRAASLRSTISVLQKQNPDLPRYQARLRLDRQALPTTAGMSDFLRELQKAGDSAGLSGGGLAVGAPGRTTAGAATIYAFPITLTATGTSAELDRFLLQLQQRQPRAVLINSVGVTPHDQAHPNRANSDLTLGMQVFVAPDATSGGGTAGATTPAPEATPSS